MSGEGETGGWLSVRGALRYIRISAGILVQDSELHLGQVTVYTSDSVFISQEMKY
jgi:hypothetical protein